LLKYGHQFFSVSYVPSLSEELNNYFLHPLHRSGLTMSQHFFVKLKYPFSKGCQSATKNLVIFHKVFHHFHLLQGNVPSVRFFTNKNRTDDQQKSDGRKKIGRMQKNGSVFCMFVWTRLKTVLFSQCLMLYEPTTENIS
jgi:hypothetical protein